MGRPARPGRGREDDPQRHARRRVARAVLAGSARRRRAEPSEHLSHLRDWRGRRGPVHCDGAAWWRIARRTAPARRAAGAGGGAGRAWRSCRARGRARARLAPPRSQAVERLPHAPRRQAAGLRAGRRRGDGHRAHPADAHVAGRRPRHTRLHGARADPRPAGGRAKRPVRTRRDALRDALRRVPVPRDHARGNPRARPVGACAGAERIASRNRDRPGDPACARARARRALCERDRDGSGPPRRAAVLRLARHAGRHGHPAADRPAVPAVAGGPGHRLPRLRPGGCDQRVARRPGRARRALESHGCPLHGRHSGSCADRRRGRRGSRDEWNSPAGGGEDPGQRAAARRARRHADLDAHAAGGADRSLRSAGRSVTPDR